MIRTDAKIMPRKSSDARTFKSEADEANWYATPEGRRQTEREFTRALKAGTLSRSTGLKIARTDPKILGQLLLQAKERTTRAISIRLPVADLEKARQITERTGLGYQTVLKKASREGLRRAG
jgi:hypothetical protein